MIAKIIGFKIGAKGEELECIAIDEKGQTVVVDPYLGITDNYVQRQKFIDTTFEDTNISKNVNDVWVADKSTFSIVTAVKSTP